MQQNAQEIQTRSGINFQYPSSDRNLQVLFQSFLDLQTMKMYKRNRSPATPRILNLRTRWRRAASLTHRHSVERPQRLQISHKEKFLHLPGIETRLLCRP
jgi:hypothetical protein